MAWEYLSSYLESLPTSPWSSLFNPYCWPMMYAELVTSFKADILTAELSCSPLFASVQNLMLKLQAFFLTLNNRIEGNVFSRLAFRNNTMD